MSKFPGSARVYIALHRPDGGVSVMEFFTRNLLDPAVDFAGWKRVEGGWFEREVLPEYVEAEIEELRREQNHQCDSWAMLDEKQTAFYLSEDRRFRNAWQHDLTIHMGKAREITRNRLREERTAPLTKLDTDYMKALEAGDKAAQAQIAAQKQNLRDVTKLPAIDKATTPEELLAIKAV